MKLVDEHDNTIPNKISSLSTLRNVSTYDLRALDEASDKLKIGTIKHVVMPLCIYIFLFRTS